MGQRVIALTMLWTGRISSTSRIFNHKLKAADENVVAVHGVASGLWSRDNSRAKPIQQLSTLITTDWLGRSIRPKSLTGAVPEY